MPISEATTPMTYSSSWTLSTSLPSVSVHSTSTVTGVESVANGADCSLSVSVSTAYCVCVSPVTKGATTSDGITMIMVTSVVIRISGNYHVDDRRLNIC